MRVHSMSVSSTIKTLTTTIINLLKTRANGDLSNLTEMGESKLRLSRSVAGYYVGDIGVAIGGIDETENTRRYLNGQTVSLAQFPDFREWLKKRKKANKSAFVDTVAEWNAEASKSTFSQCGKFFYDETADTVKLPRIVNIQGTSDITALGKLTLAGLPNITGAVRQASGSDEGASPGGVVATGAFTARKTGGNGASGSTGTGAHDWDFNASRCSSIYKDNFNTVQPETLSFPYFIQVSVGAEAVTSVTNELELNNPFSLFDVRWSAHRIDNLSWLVSNGQFNESSAFPSAYNYLVTQYDNGTDKIDTITYVSRTDVTKTETRSISYRLCKNGMKITKDKATYDQLLLDTGTAWYYVLGTTESGFYLPQTDGCLQGGTNDNAGAFTPQGIPNITGYFDGHGATGSTYKTGCFAQGTTVSGSKGSGNGFIIDFDASRCNAVYGNNPTDVQPNGVRGFLYFYVGECIQGTNLINFEAIKAQLTNELTLTMENLNKHRVIESYHNGESWYREYADGWCEQGGRADIKTGGGAYVIVTFLKPFKTIEYTPTMSVTDMSAGYTDGGAIVGTGAEIGIVRLSNSQLGLQSQTGYSGKAQRFFWRACGYIR